MQEYRQCPVCKSSQIRKVFKIKDFTVSHEDFDVWHCDQCSHRFTNPVPDQESIGPYYQSEEYVSHSNTSKGLINSIYQKVRKRTLKSKKKLLNKVSGKSNGRLLDIGCGTGEFLHTAKEAGWSVLGLEPDPGAREMGIKNYQLEILEAEKFFEIEEGQFDAITMWHVLEHVHELDAYMEKIHRLLKPGGTLIVAVPNYTSHDAAKYKEYWAAYDVPRHLYHFSPQSMAELMKRFKFSLGKMKIMPFDSFYVSMLSEKYKKGNLVRAFWRGFCSWFIAVFNAKRCSSVIYIAKTSDAR